MALQFMLEFFLIEISNIRYIFTTIYQINDENFNILQLGRCIVPGDKRTNWQTERHTFINRVNLAFFVLV